MICVHFLPMLAPASWRRFMAVMLLLVLSPAATCHADPGKEVQRRPAPAMFPFDSRQARAHQETWARHLGIAVESLNSLGGKMLLIPPGGFLMGSNDEQIQVALKQAATTQADQGTRTRIRDGEKPQHRVLITRPFLLGATEITIGQFRKFVEATSYITEAEKYGSANTATTVAATTPQKEAFDWRFPGYKQIETDAVSQVTWNDVVVFCNWLSEREKIAPCYESDEKFRWVLRLDRPGYRLPTEAEWEYASRAGTTGQFSFGDDLRELDKHAWFHLKSGSNPVRAVGSLLPNAFGLFDMHGNLFEWCQDGYDAEWYAKSPVHDPVAPDGVKRVMRGGDWFGNAVRCRSAFRGRGEQSTRSDDVGFRLVRSVLERKD